jgi:riboflavin kinase / FMN adenylyltransferase
VDRFVFEYRGRVEPGQRLGRLLGAPTANLPLATDTTLPFGTFAAVVEGLERPYRALVHVGIRPSIDAAGEPVLEAHLLDFDGDLYGRKIVVKVEHKVADEVRVGSLDALARKIADEVASVRAYFTACQVLTGADVREPLEQPATNRAGNIFGGSGAR